MRNRTLNDLVQLAKTIGPIACLVFFAGVAIADAPQLRMWLKQGSFIDGQLQPATNPGHVAIKSPQFTTPVEFDIRAIRSVAGDYSPEEPNSGHAFLLEGGTRISGQLKQWDATSLVVDSQSLGKITIQRSRLRAVEAIRDSGKRLYSGPKSIDDWKILDDTNKWQFAAGALTSPDNEAKAAGKVDLPEKFRLSLSMSWEGRADFVLSLGCKEPKKPKPKPAQNVPRRVRAQTAQNTAAVRLEMWDAQLAVVREVGNLADIAVLPLDDGISKFELEFFVDQVAGLVAVYSPRGKMLEKIQVAEEKGTANAYALLENHGKSVSLDGFDVFEWDGHLPDSTEFPDGYVLNTKDEVVPGNVQGFDADSQKLIVVDQDGKESELALNELRRIILVNTSEADADDKESSAKSRAGKGEAKKDDEVAKEDGDEEKSEDKDDEKDDDDKDGEETDSDEKDGDEKDGDEDDEKNDDGKPELKGPQFVSIPLDEPRQVEIEFADTSRLVGYIADTQDGSFQFKGDGILGSFQCEAGQIVAISGSATRFSAERKVPGTEGTLKTDFVRLSGGLVDAQQPVDGSVLVWHPYAAHSPAALTLDYGGEIVYREKKRTTRVPVAVAAPVKRQRGGLGNLIGGIFGGGNAAVGAAKKAKPDLKKLPHFEIVLRSGDTVNGAVQSVDERGVTFASDETETTFVPHDEMDSITLGRTISRPAFDDAELKRLLTVPRNKKNDPPTHLFVSTTGDYLRGRMVGINAEMVGVEVRLDVQEIPRENIARVIWLHERPWLDEKENAGDDVKEEPKVAADLKDDSDDEFLVHAVRDSKRGVTFAPEKMLDGTLSGDSGLLGECSVKISSLQSLLFGRNVGEKALALRKESWKLSLAALPKAYLDTPGGEATASVAKSSPLVGKKAPEIKLQTIDDVEFVLSENRDKVIVLDFWASWCGPCIATMPKVEAIVQEFDPREVELVAVNLQDSVERARLALKRMEIEPTTVMDVDGETARFYDAKAIPQTVIVDKEGKITHLFVGGGSKFLDQFSAALKEVLAKE